MFKSIVAVVLVVLMNSLAGAADYRNITSREAKTIHDANRKVLFLDVRTPQEFAQGVIPGALQIPISELERRRAEIPKNRPVIVYCAVGSRSRPVAQFLSRQGFGEVYNMTDGIFGWSRNGYQVVR